MILNRHMAVAFGVALASSPLNSQGAPEQERRAAEPNLKGSYAVIRILPETQKTTGVVIVGQTSPQMREDPLRFPRWETGQPRCIPRSKSDQRCDPVGPKNIANLRSDQKVVLAYLIDDPKSAFVSLEIAKWICANPSAIEARRISVTSWELTDHDDGGWGVDSDVLLDLFRRPTSVPALYDFVHSPCPKSLGRPGKCGGELVLEGDAPLLNGWNAVLGRDTADALYSGSECPLRVLSALTRWFSPKARIYEPPVP